MKTLYSLLFTFLAFSTNFYGQAGCSNLVREVTDRMTGREFIVSKNKVVVTKDKRKGIVFEPYISGDTLTFGMKVVGGGCIDDKGLIYFLFTDGTRLVLSNDASFNCDDKAVIFFSKLFKNINDLNQLTSKRIDAIRVSTLKSYVEEDFTFANATAFLNQMRCLRAAGGKDFENEVALLPKKSEENSEVIQQKNDPSPLDELSKLELTPEEKAIVDLPKQEEKVVNGGVINGKAVDLVKAPYPPAARAVRAQGVVNVQVTIDENGNVISASAVTGHPLLKQSAETAARASKFTPTTLSGKKVKVTGFLVYVFSYHK